jgi:hypothetical protein
MENTSTTPSEFHLHVASIDGNPFLDLVTGATQGLIPQGQVPEPTVANDLSVDWDIMSVTHLVLLLIRRPELSLFVVVLATRSVNF